MATEQELSTQLSNNISFDEKFDVDKAIAWTTACPQTSSQFWHEIQVEFRGFAVGKGDEGVDEPEFIITSQASPEAPSVVRYPSDRLEPASVATGVAESTILPVLRFQQLYDRRNHRVVVQCAAIDSDANNAWEQFVDALGSDLKGVAGTALSATGPWAGALGNTATAAMNMIMSHIDDALTDSPERIGGTQTIFDVDMPWKRPSSRGVYRILKIMRHGSSSAAWYLTAWLITLSGHPGESFAVDPPDDSGSAVGGGSAHGGTGTGTTGTGTTGTGSGATGTGTGTGTTGTGGTGAETETGSPGTGSGGSGPPGGMLGPDYMIPFSMRSTLGDLPVGRPFVRLAVRPDRATAAAFRLHRGEATAAELAKRYDVSERAVLNAARALEKATWEEFEARFRAGLLAEIELSTKRIG